MDVRPLALHDDLTGVLASRHPEVVDARRRAVADGFARGYEEGLSSGLAAATEQVGALERAAVARTADAASALHAAAQALAHRELVALGHFEDVIAGAALALAEAIIGRELAVASDPGADALARALALAPDGVDVVARLHPDDAATIAGAGAPLPVGVTIVPDAHVGRGGCLLDAGACRIDAQLDTALARASAALGL